ncbi:MAG: hypothetical protein ABI441_05905 [Flavobacterium sp.]
MNYKIEYWNNRTLFVFNINTITFDEFSQIIDEIIKPDKKSEIEITSWTEGFSFIKEEIEIYFEHFYNSSEPYFSFELLPRENTNDYDLLELKSIAETLNDFIHNR